jgi:PAS domain S-box-containing protein/diguanylate cyclase (GGDEF)-like protein
MLSYKSLKPKLFLLSIVTVLFITVLSMSIVYELHKSKNSLLQTRHAIGSTQLLSQTVHLMQIERGMLAGILAAKKGSNGDEAFQSVQNRVDESLKSVRNRFYSHNQGQFLVNAIDELLSERKKLIVLGASPQEIKTYYTNYIEQFLRFSRKILATMENAKNRNLVGAFVNMTAAKESLGQIRAALNIVFLTKSFEQEAFFIFSGNAHKFDAAITQFKVLAPPSCIKMYDAIYEHPKVVDTFDTIFKIVKDKNDLRYDAKEWFAGATYTIDMLQKIEKELLLQVYASLDRQILSANIKIVTIALFLLLSIITLLFVMRSLFQKVVKSGHDLQQKHDSTSDLLKQYKQAVDSSFIVSKTNPYGIITYVNDEFCEISGYSKDELIGKPHNIVRHPDMPKEAFKQMWDRIKKEKKTWTGEVKNKTKSGKSYWVKAVINPILDVHGNVVEYIAVRNDITRVKSASITDFLTGYGNRMKLRSDIEKAKTPFVAELNMDNFRQINDFYGHSFGDDVIITFANKIFHLIKNENNLQFYRLQGDEFVILAQDWQKEDFEAFIDELLYGLNDELDVNGEKLVVSYSCGISCEPQREKLLLSANMALKIAKISNANYIVYDEGLSLSKTYENNILWSKKLNTALKQNNIVAFYQPIIDNASGQVAKYECLVRMLDAGKAVSPFFFLEVAKTTRQYFDITKIVIKQAFETFANSDKEFSVNLSINDILEKEVQEYIDSMLNAYDVGNRCIFEIVESEYIENFEAVTEFIKSVKRYGCKIAIDDFGTGYSNFAYLIRLKADILKIDGSLIKDIDSDRNTYLAVQTIVSFAKKLGMQTVAEFVENEAIATKVKEMEIEFSQGYLFGAPQKNYKI